MQLGSLTSMETQEIESEYEDVTARIERLETILGDPDELDQVIITELREIKDEYDDEPHELHRGCRRRNPRGPHSGGGVRRRDERRRLHQADVARHVPRPEPRREGDHRDRSERGRPRLLRVRRQLPRLPARLHQPRADLRVEDLRDPGDVSDRPRQVRGQPTSSTSTTARRSRRW